MKRQWRSVEIDRAIQMNHFEGLGKRIRWTASKLLLNLASALMDIGKSRRLEGTPLAVQS